MPGSSTNPSAPVSKLFRPSNSKTHSQSTKATKSGALDALRADVGLVYHPRGRIVLATTCDDMPAVEWTNDNPAYLLMSRLSEIILYGLGK